MYSYKNNQSKYPNRIELCRVDIANDAREMWTTSCWLYNFTLYDRPNSQWIIWLLKSYLQMMKNANHEVNRCFASNFVNFHQRAMASQNTSLKIVYSTVYSGTDQRKHQSSASLTFVRGIHRSPKNSRKTASSLHHNSDTKNGRR